MSIGLDANQRAFVEEVANGKGHAGLSARAGAGKTTTLMAAGLKLPTDVSVLMTAFNARNAEELEARVAEASRSKSIHAKTLHRVGMAALCKAFKGKPEVNKHRARNLLRLTDYDRFVTAPDRDALVDLVKMAKNCYAQSTEELRAIAIEHDIWPATQRAKETFFHYAWEVMEKAKEFNGEIDFEDMIWLPEVLGIEYQRRYEYIFVDEAQDLTRLQFRMVTSLARDGGRIFPVGDDRQAIYGFRGAGETSFDEIIKYLDAKLLRLVVSYRCPQKVVNHVGDVVGIDIVPSEFATEGFVGETNGEEMFAYAEPGDFVLSRTNAPLAMACMNFIALGKPAEIRGRAIGSALARVVDQYMLSDSAGFLDWLREYKAKEMEAIRRRNGKDEDVSKLDDKVETLRLLAFRKTPAEIKQFLNVYYVGEDNENAKDSKIMLSTVHKAKGLESKCVWALVDSFRHGQGNTEEDNIYYVAVTRSKDRLWLVHDDALVPCKRTRSKAFERKVI